MPRGFREQLLRGVVLAGLWTVLTTELLSAFNALRPVPVFIAWLAFAAILIYLGRHARPSFQLTGLLWLPTVAVLAITFTTALLSPPNSADAMAYHMPRVIYWTQQASVRFFPTPYFNQIMLQPFAEYLMLHSYLLSGGDHLINLVQWSASLISIIGVSLIAQRLGAGPAAQAFAAFFCATLPSGILASSGAKNDYVLAAWLVLLTLFLLRFVDTGETSSAWFASAALGLALLTKATAYLFAPWILAAILLPHFRKLPHRRIILAAPLLALALNAPQYIRNLDLSGSIAGFDSAQGNGFFRWRNETFGWKPALSNLLRNTSEQIGSSSESWNNSVYDAVARIHSTFGIDLNDPATTWRASTFHSPRSTNHEADAANPLHLTILVLAVVVLHRNPRLMLYALALICGFIAFSAYLKWQPFMARLILPLFVLASPLPALIPLRKRYLQAAALAFCLVLLYTTRYVALNNWTRPLRGPHSVFQLSRHQRYFADMTQWSNTADYLDAVDALKQSPCQTIGIDINGLQLEYPLQALLLERRPALQFVHVGVANASTKYLAPAAQPACAVVCLDCSTQYPFPHSQASGKFVVFY